MFISATKTHAFKKEKKRKEEGKIRTDARVKIISTHQTASEFNANVCQ